MADPSSPAVVFQSLLRTMLDGSSRTLTKRNIEDFRVILHMIMHECSKANIETGKTWVFEHCHSPAHTVALMEYILSLSRSRSGQEERIHIIYLLNDILFHTARKQLSWMKDAMLPALVPLLKLAYEAAESAEYKAKLMKVITFWSDKNIFEPNIINNIRHDITEQGASYKPLPYFNVDQQQAMRFQQAPYPFPQQSFPQFQQNPMVQHLPPLPTKQYYEMPAGLMLFAKNDDYKPIDPAMIKYPFPRPQPSKELLNAVHDFYAGLDLSNVDDMILDEKPANNIDVQGWEKGYLDRYVGSMTQRKQEQLDDQQLASRSRSREYSRSSYDRNNNSRDYGRRSRSPSPTYHSSYRPQKSYSRSRSRSRSRSHSRSRSRSRSPQLRRRSPPRGRSPVNRRAQRSPPPRLYSNRRPYRSQSRSRSRSPPPISTAPFMSNYRPSNSSGSISHNNATRGADFGVRSGLAPENRYMGLGSKNALDEFDSFRRNKSQAFNRREPHQPITCYRCNKAGHLARECNSL